MKDEKNISAKIITESEIKYKGESEFITTEEKAQYEVFRNGELPKQTIEKWIRNDLGAIMSFVQGCLTDPTIFRAVADAYYERYKKLHEDQKTNESKRTTAGQP